VGGRLSNNINFQAVLTASMAMHDATKQLVTCRGVWLNPKFQSNLSSGKRTTADLVVNLIILSVTSVSVEIG